VFQRIKKEFHAMHAISFIQNLAVITTVLTPYLIRSADPLSMKLAAMMPKRIARVFGLYGEWRRSIQPQEQGALLASMIHRVLLQVGAYADADRFAGNLG
jgi:hypothetical protein